MISAQVTIEERLEELNRQVQALQARVEALANQISLGLASPATPANVEARPSGDESVLDAPSLALPSTAVLPGVAAACFVLVVALILRTIADSGAIDRTAGLVLGSVYAALVIVLGYYRHARSQTLSSVFATCGLLLFYAILLEGHHRFGLVTAPVAYAALGGALIGVTALGWRHTPVTSVGIGVFGAAAVGLLLEFPEPRFPYLSVLMLGASLSGYAMSSIPRCGWLKWSTLLLSLFFWALWVVRIHTATQRGEFDPEALAISWFVPLLVCFGALYTGIAMWSARRRGTRFGAFEALLPTVAAVGGYAAARLALVSSFASGRALPTLALGGAAGFVALGWLLSRAPHHRMRAVSSFIVPAPAILALALPAAMGGVGRALIPWALAAMAIALLSAHWRSRPVRGVSYALQGYACVAAALAGLFAVHAPVTVADIILPVAVAGLALAHYAGCRRWKSRRDGSWLSVVDPHDRAALVCLLAGVVYLYGASRHILYALGSQSADDGAVIFQTSQSILINGGAVILATVGLVLASGEILVAALLVALIGAAKVFGYDMLTLSGVPLVVSVFSFGMAAALGSLVWTRWKRPALTG